MKQHGHEKLVGKFTVTGITHDLFHVRFLRGHKFKEYPVDFRERRIVRDLVDCLIVFLGKLGENSNHSVTEQSQLQTFSG